MGDINLDTMLITDIGSTTTKALLITKQAGEYRFSCQVEVPTTVEKPREDVRIGVKEAVRLVEQRAGVDLLDEAEAFKVPYLTTSSAGGGLQMLVFGLTSVDTGKAADITAYGAGAVILKRFTIDDRIPAIHKMRLIRDLHPDLILMAGGIDGGDIANLVRLAEILSLANPRPKFDEAARNHLIFCGNIDARRFISRALDEKFTVHYADNIRPNFLELNTASAKAKILDLFMNHVMERAPGYAEMKKVVSRGIIPTPTGVENILKLYSEKRAVNIVMVDIGGATTDIFSNIYGDYTRTVAANIGMSYSICNTMANAGSERIMADLPDQFSESDVRNYLSNKMLQPTYVPQSEGEFLVEHALAIGGIELAWKQHREINFSIATLGFLDRMRKRKDYDPFQELFYGLDMQSLFQVSDIDTIIGTGGVLAHTKTREQALRILVDGFRPCGITKIAIDRFFKSPHLGVLSTIDSALALDLFERECLEEIGYVVAPTGDINPSKVALTVRDMDRDREHHILGGDVLYLPDGGKFTMVLGKKLCLQNHDTESDLTTKLPVLFDCRGRGEGAMDRSLSSYGIPGFGTSEVQFCSQIQMSPGDIVSGTYRFKRELPYEGEIFVRTGDQVAPDSLIGQNRFTPPRLYIVDMQRLVGYDHELSPDEIERGILVEVGDEVNIGQRMFRYQGMVLGGHYYCNSPVRGKVVQIEPTGLVILREIQDHSLDPKVVEIAKYLHVKPKHIQNRLEFKVGDFVQKGEQLVRGSGARLPISAPCTGTLKKIDTTHGNVVIQYDIKPIVLRAFVQGTVDVVENHLSAEIVGRGSILPGIIGFGPEASGEIVLFGEKEFQWEAIKGKVVVCFEPVGEDFLRRCAETGASGIVAPSLDNIDWVRFGGSELGVALTGDEDIPFCLVLTEGFGRIEMNEAHRSFLRSAQGRYASLIGRTQIRAGVQRPMLMISD